jgi:serine/threonine protein phosphatase PrpC
MKFGGFSRPFRGLNICGDSFVVEERDGGLLAAVIDGLGHGLEAAEAARRAARVLEANAAEPVVTLIERCHAALRRTRGAVMSVASLRAGELTWTGVGNVEGFLLRWRRTDGPARETINVRGGIVGYQIPQVRATTVPVSEGDTLVMVTDGIRSSFAADLKLPQAPQDMADGLLARHGRGSDDALALVARYLGHPG